MAEDMSKMLQQLQELQDQMNRVQEELAQLQATAEAGGGMVTVTANGKQQVLSVKIDKEVIDPNDAEMLEDLIVAAVNRALDRSREVAGSRMGEATRSMMPPGFPPLM